MPLASASLVPESLRIACSAGVGCPTMRSLATLGALLFGASLAHANSVDDCNQVRDLTRQLRENLAAAHLNRANICARRGKYPLARCAFRSSTTATA